jgi:hypothetical protein
LLRANLKFIISDLILSSTSLFDELGANSEAVATTLETETAVVAAAALAAVAILVPNVYAVLYSTCWCY